MKTALELSMNYDSIPLSKRLAGINEGRPQLQTKTLNAGILIFLFNENAYIIINIIYI